MDVKTLSSQQVSWYDYKLKIRNETNKGVEGWPGMDIKDRAQGMKLKEDRRMDYIGEIK